MCLCPNVTTVQSVSRARPLSLLCHPPLLQVALVDIRGRIIKHRDEGSDFFSTAYEGMRADYLDAHIPGAVFVDWTKVP